MDAESLEQRLGHPFSEPGLLRQALTHRSHGQANNERLEFLGDSVLGLAISTLLFERFPSDDEGDLSRLRAFLVRQQTLYKVAQRIRLGDALRLGEGESRSGGFRRPSILADALEAVIGAIYLDAGFEAARAAIGRLYAPELESADPRSVGKDAKTRLQEELQRRKLPLPVYAVIATHGAAHSQSFEVECQIARLEISSLGAGPSRRVAEQAAADAALRKVLEYAAEAGRSGARADGATKAAAVPRKRRSADTATVPGRKSV